MHAILRYADHMIDPMKLTKINPPGKVGPPKYINGQQTVEELLKDIEIRRKYLSIGIAPNE